MGDHPISFLGNPHRTHWDRVVLSGSHVALHGHWPRLRLGVRREDLPSGTKSANAAPAEAEAWALALLRAQTLRPPTPSSAEYYENARKFAQCPHCCGAAVAVAAASPAPRPRAHCTAARDHPVPVLLGEPAGRFGTHTSSLLSPANEYFCAVVAENESEQERAGTCCSAASSQSKRRAAARSARSQRRLGRRRRLQRVVEPPFYKDVWHSQTQGAGAPKRAERRFRLCLTDEMFCSEVKYRSGQRGRPAPEHPSRCGHWTVFLLGSR